MLDSNPEEKSGQLPVFNAHTHEEIVQWLQRQLNRYDTTDLYTLLKDGGYSLRYGHFIHVQKD